MASPSQGTNARTRHLALILPALLAGLIVAFLMAPPGQAASPVASAARVHGAELRLAQAQARAARLARLADAACAHGATRLCVARWDRQHTAAAHAASLRRTVTRLRAAAAVTRNGKKWTTTTTTTPTTTTTSTTTTSTTSTTSTTPTTTSTTTSTTPTSTTTSTTSTGTTTTTTSATTFQPGIAVGPNPVYDLTGVQKLGARTARVEFGIGASTSTIAPVISAYASKGVRVLLLASFWGRIPSTTEAQNLATWAKAFGPGGTFWAGRTDGAYAVQDIEFGNETSYDYQGTQNQGGAYALRFKDAQVAIQAANPQVGLLAQADDQTGTWIDSMFAAVPDLGSRVAGWTLHPYGTDWAITRINRLLTKTAAHGAPATIPVDLTEWGLATDNGNCLSDNYGWNPCMTYDEAASLLSTRLATFRSYFGTRLRMFILYGSADAQPSGATTNREDYFGALHNDLTDKGSWSTAVRQVLAQTS